MTVTSKKGAAFYDSIDTLSQWGFQKNTCDRCGKHNSEIDGHLMQCSRCKNRYHCSVACFNADILEHSKWCQQVGVLGTASREATNTKKAHQEATEPNCEKGSSIEKGACEKERRRRKRPESESNKQSDRKQPSKFDEKVSAADLFFRWNNSTDSAFFSNDDVEAWATCQVEDINLSNHSSFSTDSNRSNTIPVITAVSEEDVEYFRESESDSDASNKKKREKKEKHGKGGSNVEKSRQRRSGKKKGALFSEGSDFEKSPRKKAARSRPNQEVEVGSDLRRSPRKDVGGDNERPLRRKVMEGDQKSSSRAKKERKASTIIHHEGGAEKSPQNIKGMKKVTIVAGNKGSKDVSGKSPRKMKTRREHLGSETGKRVEGMSPRKTIESPTREIRRDDGKSPSRREKRKSSPRKTKTRAGIGDDAKTGMVVVFERDSSFPGYDSGDDKRDLDFFLGGAKQGNKAQTTVHTDAATGVLTDTATGEMRVQAKSQTNNQAQVRPRHEGLSSQYGTTDSKMMEERADEVVRAIDEVLSQSSASCQSYIAEASPISKKQEKYSPGGDKGGRERNSTITKFGRQTRRPSITRKFGDMDLGACAYVPKEPKKTNIVRNRSISRNRGIVPEKEKVIKSPGKRFSLQERVCVDTESSPRRLSAPTILRGDSKADSPKLTASCVNHPKGFPSEKLEHSQVSSKQPGKRLVISAGDQKKDDDVVDDTPKQEYVMGESPRKLKTRSPNRTRSRRLSRSPSKRSRVRSYSNIPRAEGSEPKSPSVPDWVRKSPLKETPRGLRLRTDGSICPLRPRVHLG